MPLTPEPTRPPTPPKDDHIYGFLDRNTVLYSRQGFYIVRLPSFRNFLDLVATHPVFHSDTYIYRGQTDAAWRLEPSLTRKLKHLTDKQRDAARRRHKQRARLALRGHLPTPSHIVDTLLDALNSPDRRINHLGSTAHDQPTPPSHIDIRDLNLWAVAQHYGLATPLLDWTTAPLTALFFAFAPGADLPATGYCAVYLLHRRLVASKTAELRAVHETTLDLIDSLTNDNRRLLSQSGMFSICSRDIPVEKWITSSFRAKDETSYPVLLKFLIPTNDRAECVSLLKAFGVNSLTVYPDITGAANHCNHLLDKDIEHTA